MSNTDHTVRVSGFPAGTTKEAVESFFVRVGNVAAVTFSPESDTASTTTVAFVSFHNAGDALEALAMSGVEFADNAPLSVVRADSEVDAGDAKTAATQNTAALVDDKIDDNAAASNNNNNNNDNNSKKEKEEAEDEKKNNDRDAHKICVLNYTPDTTAAQFHRFFADCGPIIDLYINRHPTKRRIAFVGFSTESAVSAALSKNGESLNGAVLTIERKRRVSHEHRVHISGLPADITADALRSFFSSSSSASSSSSSTAANCTVVDCFVAAAEGYGYVNVQSAEEVARAVALSGQTIGGSILTIEERPLHCTACNGRGHTRAQCPSRPPHFNNKNNKNNKNYKKNKYQNSENRPALLRCHRCGRPGHFARDCDAPPAGGAVRRCYRDDSIDSFKNKNKNKNKNEDREKEKEKEDEERVYRRRRRERDDSRDRRHRRSRSRSYERRSRSRSYERRDRRERRRRSSTPPRRDRNRRSRSRSPRRDRW